ncbi:hypothetical protein ACLOJK_001483 [Asimina triloba]
MRLPGHLSKKYGQANYVLFTLSSSALSDAREKQLLLHLSAMAERQTGQSPITRPTGWSASPTFLQRLQGQTPNSTQAVGFLTLVISGGILLFLAGLTLTATVLGLIFVTPLIILCSPIWVPVGTVLFIAVAGFSAMSAFAVAMAAAIAWTYRYVRGRRPVGSDRVDYARSRIADTASHVKDYAREYGGYLQSKVKDAAPGA